MEERVEDRAPRRKAAVLGVVLVLVVVVAACLGAAAYFPHQVAQMLNLAPVSTVGTDTQPASEAEAPEEVPEPVVLSPEEQEAADRYFGATDVLPTKRVATCGDVPIYSPIAQNRITGVLFHQASYETALVLTTEMPEASLEGLSQDNPVRVNNAQVEGEWCDADALHMYRTSDATNMDTSIDVGARWETMVRAPVTGTVVLVEDYLLYGEVPDVKIHIQPEGHPELDVVLLHQYNPEVKAGDKVEGGVTPLAHVRDIAKDLTDVQLGFCTPPDDPGNHSHVQVNNADYPGYREANLKNAYVVK